MKQVFFLVIIMCSTSLFSQNVKYGIKAGGNILSVDHDDISSLEDNISFHVGGMVEYSLKESTFLQLEIIYSNLSYSLITENNGRVLGGAWGVNVEKITRDYELNYLNLPIYLKYEILDGFTANIGPQFGLLLNSDESLEYKNYDTGEYISTIYDNRYKNTDFGFNLGLSYYSKNGIGFSTNYYFGTSNVNDDDNLGWRSNRVFQVSIGYFFN